MRLFSLFSLVLERIQERGGEDIVTRQARKVLLEERCEGETSGEAEQILLETRYGNIIPRIMRYTE